LTVTSLSVIVTATAGYATRQPIGVFEHGLVIQRLKLTEHGATGSFNVLHQLPGTVFQQSFDSVFSLMLLLLLVLSLNCHLLQVNLGWSVSQQLLLLHLFWKMTPGNYVNRVYGMDVLPVTQPLVSQHGEKHKAVT